MKKRRFKKTKRLLQTACLAVGLALAGWSGGPAVETAAAATVVPPTIEVSGTISPTTSLTDVWVIYSLNSSGYPSSIYSHEAANVTSGNVGTFSFTVDDDPSWYNGESYTVMGIYDDGTGGTGVCVGGTGISVGDSWDSLFSTNETTVLGWLQSGDTDDLEIFYSDTDNFVTIAQGIGSDINLWNFSDATANGSAHADSSVPIPGALWLLGSGLFGLVAIRRRKKS